MFPTELGSCRHGSARARRTCLLFLIAVHCCCTTYDKCYAFPTTDAATARRAQQLSAYQRETNANKVAIVEDDIRITDSDPYANDMNLMLRSTVSDKSKAWIHGIVPYYIDSTFFNDEDIETIYSAIDEFHHKTCVRFIQREEQTPYLFITPLSRCWSEIGMPIGEGIRTLSLGSSCLERRGTVIHELMHVLGFWHEQNRADRDDYITIHWENIREGLQHNFFKYNTQKVDTANEPYDYQSIMHYSSFAFAKDPRDPTIEPRLPVMIGQRFELSPGDIRKINRVYNCSASNLPFLPAYSRAPPQSATVAPSPNRGQQQQPQKPDSSNDAIIFPSAASSSAKDFSLPSNGHARPPSINGFQNSGSFSTGSSSKGSSSIGSSSSGSQSHSAIVFPNIKDYVPLPFKFDWSAASRTTPNPRIVWPS